MIVAVTGHRPNRLHIGVDRVAEHLDGVFATLACDPKSEPCIAVSALAEGADRLFARAALAHGFELRALLPFASTDYETTFGDTSTTGHYRELLALASDVIEMPGTLAEDTAGYEAVGRRLVDECDVLVAVWDGKPAAGRGGTPEIIAYALSKARKTIWVNASIDTDPVDLLSIDPAVATQALKSRSRQ